MEAGGGLLLFEQRAWARGFARIAGVDEAGRGPLAGPVVAAAVVFSRPFLERESHGLLARLTDSKQLTAGQREHFFELLTGCPDVETAVAFVSVTEIDRLNILQATHRCMGQALRSLRGLPDCALVDGLPVPGFPCPSEAIVHGDARSLSIAAASVMAKVTRDRWMDSLDRRYPEYGFARHKGYGTAAHIQALWKYGASAEHRRSFRPVRDIAAIQNRLRPPAERRPAGAPPDAAAIQAG